MCCGTEGGASPLPFWGRSVPGMQPPACGCWLESCLPRACAVTAGCECRRLDHLGVIRWVTLTAIAVMRRLPGLPPVILAGTVVFHGQPVSSVTMSVCPLCMRRTSKLPDSDRGQISGTRGCAYPGLTLAGLRFPLALPIEPRHPGPAPAHASPDWIGRGYFGRVRAYPFDRSLLPLADCGVRPGTDARIAGGPIRPGPGAESRGHGRILVG